MEFLTSCAPRSPENMVEQRPQRYAEFLLDNWTVWGRCVGIGLCRTWWSNPRSQVCCTSCLTNLTIVERVSMFFSPNNMASIAKASACECDSLARSSCHLYGHTFKNFSKARGSAASNALRRTGVQRTAWTAKKCSCNRKWRTWFTSIAHTRVVG